MTCMRELYAPSIIVTYLPVFVAYVALTLLNYARTVLTQPYMASGGKDTSFEDGMWPGGTTVS